MEPNWGLARKRQHLEQRARIVQAIRAFFVAAGFLEVETPHLLPGNAPELHIDPVAAGDGFLHTSPELCMKRLLAAGYRQIFQLCRCWRRGERGARHLPEYTMLEWYRSGCDYHTLMGDCEELLAFLVPSGSLRWQGEEIDLVAPFERLTVREAFARHAAGSLDRALAEGRFDEVMALEIEPHLGRRRPTFLYEYPAACAALARKKSGAPQLAERFELYIAGLELANAFSELTDPDEQRQRFVREEDARRRMGKAPVPLPEKFLAELGALDSAAGIALGVDRLVMLLTDAATIDAVVAFTPEDL
ncbi:translation elongation factor P-lysine lysyltransferase [Desulfuromonas sp. DDH964]|uniref:EF-P lysine aminoacylase EpmA n=1 Tax=Desulfuromonas sp. DDH964 TaxID=1823759 RepID=UPI00078BB6A1|nr:EF-P lysine aminoacylase EpmA [Desulfuromonas sp. DDH964]AMV73306.1 translation elongation factor P-lysine lysyltransferase [Desulfuromonas sp. DDH964]